MAAVSAPSGRSLIGKVAAAIDSRAGAARTPRRAMAFARDHVGTLAALGFADAAGWHAGTIWGLLASAGAILVAEFKVRD